MSQEKKSSQQHYCESKMDSNIDSKEKQQQQFEELFDSGYNYNIQSKTFLDLDNEEYDNIQQQHSSSNPQQHSDHHHHSQPSNSKQQQTNRDNNNDDDKNKFDTVQQWSDSGVCITDSGLSIQEDYENYESNIDLNENPDDNKQSYSLVEKDSSNENKNSLELWLKHNSDAET